MLTVFPYDVVRVTLFTNLIGLSYSFRNYNSMREMDFMNNIHMNLSNEEMTKIKVLHIDKAYNFIVQHFLI